MTVAMFESVPSGDQEQKRGETLLVRGPGIAFAGSHAGTSRADSQGKVKTRL